MDLKQHCGTDERRQKVLDSSKMVGALKLNGIDYLEVLDRDAPSKALRQKLIDLVFLKPDGVLSGTGASLLDKDNFVIEGGTRIQSVRILNVEKSPAVTPALRLTLDRAGDFSRYRLRMRGSAAVDDPPDNFDPVLASLTFSFKADCPTDFDCVVATPPDVEANPPPPIDYLAKDYESLRRLMLDRMATTIPAWTERSPADLGVTLVETLAYGADMASYYQDAVATEAYLSRARLRASVRRHARLLAYEMAEGANSRVFVAIEAAIDATRGSPPLLPRGAMLLSRPSGTGSSVNLPPALRPDPVLVRDLIRDGARVFEAMEDITSLRVKRNALHFHTWSGANCCLPAGTTEAYLVGTLADTGLTEGDVLILEEVTPMGGTADSPPDATHRQAVRLSAPPKELVDRVDDTLDATVIEIRWHLADALRFPLNLQGAGARPGAIARGNIVLADYGRTLDYVFANTADPQVVANSLHADLAGKSGLWPDDVPDAGLYRPLLTDEPVTRAEAYDVLRARRRPAVEALQQAVGAAEPAVTLIGAGETWKARPDLLLSDRFSPEFTVEAQNAGGAELRFGDGRFAKRPAAGTSFQARVRVGNGPTGMVGAGAIGFVITDDPAPISGVTNPLPTSGGTPAESLTTVKLAAPRAFRKQRRAVTASDYAFFAEQHPDVQRAIADRRWTGSWQTVFISVDRLGGRDVDAAFEKELRGFLEPLRLAGHDIEIEPPDFVPLDIALIVCVARGYYAGDVEDALLDRFSAGVRRDRTPGFFNLDSFSFADPVRLSPIIAQAMAVPGVHWVGLNLDGFPTKGRFGPLDDQSIDYGDTGLIPIGRRQIARLDNDPNAPERGRLRFVMEGGA